MFSPPAQWVFPPGQSLVDKTTTTVRQTAGDRGGPQARVPRGVGAAKLSTVETTAPEVSSVNHPDKRKRLRGSTICDNRSMATDDSSARRTGRVSAGILGAAGSLACATSMVLVAVGIGVSASASGMAAMSGTTADGPHGVLGALLRVGPWLQLISTALVVVAFALSRRPVATIPALLAGILLQFGMYAQTTFVVMYLSIAVGYALWVALYLWVHGVPPIGRWRSQFSAS